MRVDFYQLSRDPAEQAIAAIAAKALAGGQRMLVVADDDGLLDRVSEALWSTREAFLANGKTGAGHEDRQPVLLSPALEAANGAKILALADGKWREADGFDRVLLFFDGRTIDDARGLWRRLRERVGVERNYYSQASGRWEKTG
ncbi:DNA polymerase III subunit chi [Novosphingobium sp. TH158]|uniref:DNA polymerase III subunit chi n=1 Tax=Novosphingobium sp. TH158 TaxID=2067455 RepID=UPI000C7BAEBB|nr:DNA polymerase III subunit chi [Novosphingobium sp. TH158]PLK26080.1 DNA polymerase III subunit chi [Novosphingobium sp. TH158]